MNLLKENSKIYIAGSTGMVGSSICRLLLKKGFILNNNLLTPSRKDLDLRNNDQLHNWFSINYPDIVIISAARVGGILANKTYPVDFLLENLKIQNNLIEKSYEFGVKKLLFLGSSCIYPKLSEQPIKEKYLLKGSLEDTNQWYAIAKIAGLKLCEAYKKQYSFNTLSLMPTNLYGPNDNYDLNSSHVMAALLRKFIEAKLSNKKNVTCWGTGKPLREFLYVDDFAEACLFILSNWEKINNNLPKDENGNILNWLNIGSDFEISINDLANKIGSIINYRGEINWDKTKPDGTPRKKLNTDTMNNLGWVAQTDLDKGIRKTIESFKLNKN
tara:strand:+ start:305 stop:1291 length:987 start_codon:yes stop_codon:yes gene_type:complete